jgi:hypothetical protein
MDMIRHDYPGKNRQSLILLAIFYTVNNNIPVLFPCKDIYPKKPPEKSGNERHIDLLFDNLSVYLHLL